MSHQDQHVAQVRRREFQRQTWCWWCISGSLPGLGSSQRLTTKILLEMQPDGQHLGHVKEGGHPTCLVWPACTASSEDLPPGASPWDLQDGNWSLQLTYSPINIPILRKGGILKIREHLPGSLQRGLSSAIAHTRDVLGQGAGC